MVKLIEETRKEAVQFTVYKQSEENRTKGFHANHSEYHIKPGGTKMMATGSW